MVTRPLVTPVTLPEPSTVAMAVLLLLHRPPAVASLRPTAEPTQPVAAPLMEATVGRAFIVSMLVTVAVPQLLAMV